MIHIGICYLPATAVMLATLIAGCDTNPVEPISGPGGEDRLSRLRVDGNRIVDAEGKDVVLRGVAVVDPLVGSHFGDRRPSEADFATLSNDWNADIVRVPMHPGLMANNPDYLRDFVDPLVDWAQDHGLYLLLGYHAHGNPLTGEVEDTPWGFESPWHGNPYNPDIGLAVESLTAVAFRYSDKPQVLYSVFNEPAFVSWADWRPVAERLVDTVRGIHPEALILVSGVNFASQLEAALSDPVRREEIVYEIHPYPWVEDRWKTVVTELSRTHPVFLGEWGFGDEHPASTSDYGEALVSYCEEMGLGWTAWIWDNDWTPRMFTSRSRSQLTEFGSLVKEALAEPRVLALQGFSAQ